MWIPKIFKKQAQKETEDAVFVYKDKNTGDIGFSNKKGIFQNISGFDQDVINALNAATTPSNTNPFVTQSELNSQNEFTELLDVSVSYAGNAGKILVVNATEDGIEADNPAASENIATNNLIFTANSNTDFAGFTATFDNAELKIIADANTSGDKPFQVTKADGTTVIFDVRGNGQIGFNGNIDADYIATFKGSTLSGNAYFTRTAAGINIQAEGNGLSAYCGSQNHTLAQWFGDGATTIGVWGRATSGTGIKAETISIGLALEVIGKSKFVSQPTSNAGLSAGETYVGTAADALANGDKILIIKQ